MPIKLTMKRWERGPSLKLVFSVVSTAVGENIVTDPIPVNNLAVVRFKFDHVLLDQYTLEPSVSLKKTDAAMYSKSTVKIKISCDEFKRDWICSDGWIDYVRMRPKVRNFSIEVAYCKVCSYVLEVNIIVLDIKPAVLFPKFYEVMHTADFRMNIQGGSVMLHKAVLATHSTLFLNSETVGNLSIDGATEQTLHHFRDYVYLGNLPDSGLEYLLLIATACEMDKLKSDCIEKLAETVTPDKLNSLIELALKNNIPGLVWGILNFTPDSVIHKAHQMR